MKTLYQYIIESRRGLDTLDKLPAIILSHTIDLRTPKNLSNPDNIWFLIKNSKGNDKTLCIRKQHEEKAKKLLGEFGTLGEFDDNKNTYFIIGDKGLKFKIHLSEATIDGKTIKVTDKTQESATAVVFNRLTQLDGLPTEKWYNDIFDEVSLYWNMEITSDWRRSIPLTCELLIQFISSYGGDIKNWRMERPKGFQRGQDIAMAMYDFIGEYAKRVGASDRNSVDPSDTFIYDTTAKPEILKNIAELSKDIKKSDTDIYDIKNKIDKIFYKSKTPIFAGLSLKFSSRPKIEFCNTDGYYGINGKTKRMMIEVSSFSYKTTGKTFTIICQGTFGQFSSKAHIEYRTQGRGSMRAAISIFPDDGPKESQAGDCPIGKFKKIFRLNDTTEKNRDDAFKIIKSRLETDPEVIQALTEIISLGTKNHADCLPYIIIH